MANTIEKQMWDYYQINLDNNNDPFCQLMEYIELCGYCLDPLCNCSNANMWRDRESVWNDADEDHFDDLPKNIKTVLVNKFKKIYLPQPLFQIKCPICRTINHIHDNQKQLYGISDKCVICHENVCQLNLPECGHVCLCLKCYNQLKSEI